MFEDNVFGMELFRSKVGKDLGLGVQMIFRYFRQRVLRDEKKKKIYLSLV